MKTIDGMRGSGSEWIKQCNEQKEKKENEKAEKLGVSIKKK